MATINVNSASSLAVGGEERDGGDTILLASGNYGIRRYQRP